eukprot:4611497-Pleurochrysis_carterae.AAC.1
MRHSTALFLSRFWALVPEISKCGRDRAERAVRFQITGSGCEGRRRQRVAKLCKGRCAVRARVGMILVDV